MPDRLQEPDGRWEEAGSDAGVAAPVEDDGSRPGAPADDRVEDGAPGVEGVAGIPVFAPAEEAEEVADGDRPVSSEDAAPRGEAARFPGEPTGDVEEVPDYRGMAAARAVIGEAGEAEGPLLDAWYASHPEEAVAAAVAAVSTPRALEVVIGPDDRVQIRGTTSAPWRWICSLRITAADGSQWIGTGWLVSPRTVITAGHCVHIANRGGWVHSVDVMPGRDGAREPLGRCTARSFRSVVGWTRSGHRNHDYGAIVLPRGCAFPRLGAFGFAALPDDTLGRLWLNLSGYPGDKPAGTQWFHSRTARSVTPRTLVYEIDTAGGQSGAPVWRYADGQRHAVAIHTNGSLSGNSATRISRSVFDNLRTWKAEGS